MLVLTTICIDNPIPESPQGKGKQFWLLDGLRDILLGGGKMAKISRLGLWLSPSETDLG